MAKKTTKKKVSKKDIVLAIFVTLLFIFGLTIFFISPSLSYKSQPPTDYISQYNCVYNYRKNDKSFWSITAEDDLICKIIDVSGAQINDELIMYNENNDILLRTDVLTYEGKTIWQNEYVCAIYINNKVSCAINTDTGNRKVNVYDENRNKIASIDFDIGYNVGVLKNIDGDAIAQYNTTPQSNDFIISILDGCNFSNEEVIMLFTLFEDNSITNFYRPIFN